MELLYLNNIQVDLPKNSIALTLQMNDIAELKDRQVNYSNNIKLPMTSKNIKAMEMLGVAGNKSTTPYNKINVKYILNGIEVISNGYGVLNKTTSNYELVIYDSTKDVFADIKGLTLSDLDFSAWNHNLDLETFKDSHSATNGYIYALANYSGNGDANFTLESHSPSFYTHTLFEMIFTQAGYTISGDIFSNTDYKSRIIPMKDGVLRETNQDLLLKYRNNSAGGSEESYTFGTTLTTASYLKQSWISTIDGSIRINGIGNVIETVGIDFEILLDIAGTVYTVPTSVFFDSDNFAFFNYNVSIGDVINIYIQATSVLVTSTQLQTITFSTNYILDIYKIEEYVIIKIEDEIGQTLQIDFIKDIMQRFAMTVVRKRNSKEYRFITMKELLTDQANAEDWSEIYSNFLSEEYRPNYAIKNYFKHKYDKNENDTELTWADGVLNVANQNLDDTKTVLTSIFKASDTFQTINDTLYPEAYFLNKWEYKEVENEGVESYIFEPKKDDIRIFKLTNKTRNISVFVLWGGGESELLTDSRPYLDFKQVDYETELSNYYSEIQTMLSNYKKITVELNLTLIDFYKIDLFKLVYLKQFGKYFYINKVNNFKPHQKTKVELIQI